MAYRGRFAPSPTGPLHAGSLVAALASWLDARAHGGQWLVRIEDVDTPRCVPAMASVILSQLAAVGLVPDEAPLFQSRRSHAYQQALEDLAARGLAYPCTCSRKDIKAARRAMGHTDGRRANLVYPGTCRAGLAALRGAARHDPLNPQGKAQPGTPGHTQNGTPGHAQNKAQPVWRLRIDSCLSNRPLAPVPQSLLDINSIANPVFNWLDRRLGAQQQQVEKAVGDFPLKRADGCFTYQLAMVVDDAAQGITHVVRGEDLADNTARQILLQRALDLPTPAYLHTPLVLAPNGEKLSKQNGAEPLDTDHPQAALQALNTAAQTLRLTDRRGPIGAGLGADVSAALAAWVQEWQPLYNPGRERKQPR